jgi:hypothetical protein
MQQIIKNSLSKIDLKLSLYHTPRYDNNGHINGGFYSIVNEENQECVTKFMIEQLAGCNGIAVSRKVSISEQYRGKGYGSIFCELRENLARFFGYSVIMCTTTSDNLIQRKIMVKNEWNCINVFNNKKTNHEVRIYLKNL